MSRNFKLNDKTGQAFLQEKRAELQQRKQITRIERTRNVRLRDIETQSYLLEEKLKSFRRGTTNLNSYFDKKKSGVDKNTIWFPLERSHEDWEPRPCWIGKSSINQSSCVHFPCRTFTSYHFFHRELPKWILTGAEETVRKSKTETHSLVEKPEQEMNLRESHETNEAVNINRLPAIEFPENMTAKERKLKIIISRKRLQNERENKPADRSINYGKPTPIRRLKRPVRPCVRQMDTRT